VARILFTRKPTGPVLSALVPPRAVVSPAPIVSGAAVGNAPQAHLSPVQPSGGAIGSRRDYWRALLAHQRAQAGVAHWRSPH
jgi:hypothetical protein